MHDKNEVFNHYSTILDKMLEMPFYKTYFQSPYDIGCDYYPAIDGIKIECGATRCCIIDETYDWVIKIDIAEDSEGFCSDREVAFYEAAQKIGVAEAFAPVYKLGTYTRTIEFYDAADVRDCIGYDCDDDNEYWVKEEKKLAVSLGAPYPVTISFSIYGSLKVSFDLADDPELPPHSEVIDISPLCDRYQEIGYRFAADYDKKTFEKLSDFMYDNNINDIHWGNVGMLQGRIVMLDYGGFYE